MHYLIRSPYRLFRTSVLLLSAGLPLCAAVLPSSAVAAYAATADEESGVSTATKSRVAAVRLPANTFRYSGKNEIAKYAEALAKLFGVEQGQLGELEVLAWQEGGAARKELPAVLKQEGYGYVTREPLQIDGGRIIPFVAAAPGEKGKVLALWIEQGKSLLLAWALSGTPAGPERIPAPAAAPSLKAAPAAPKADGQTVPIKTSRLTGLPLAPGAKAASAPDQLSGIAERLGATARQMGIGDGVDPTSAELLGWESGSAAPRTALYAALEQAGYARKDSAPVKNNAGTFSSFTATGPSATLVGMWVEDGAHLVLAWGRVTGNGAAAAPVREERSQPAVKQPAAAPAPAGETIRIELQPQAYYVNPLKGTMPPIPQFPNLAKKPGVVRGYVYDSKGRPLKGAKLGVRSTAVGGFYSGASATTDDQGYYEISAPTGVAHFYCAGYAVEHGEGLAAMALHPADGSMETFATPSGAVRNWVLLPYGIADRARVQDDPRAGSNYYGGTVVLGWSIDEGGIFSSPNYLPNQSTFEFTLTPTGPLLDGSQSRTITIRKTVSTGTSNQLYVNNIPAGPYRVSAKLVSGGALRIRETGPYTNRPFGLEPKQAVGQGALMLRPDTADAGMVPGGHGAWGQISLTLERP